MGLSFFLQLTSLSSWQLPLFWWPLSSTLLKLRFGQPPPAQPLPMFCVPAGRCGLRLDFYCGLRQVGKPCVVPFPSGLWSDDKLPKSLRITPHIASLSCSCLTLSGCHPCSTRRRHAKLVCRAVYRSFLTPHIRQPAVWLRAVLPLLLQTFDQLEQVQNIPGTFHVRNTAFDSLVPQVLWTK